MPAHQHPCTCKKLHPDEWLGAHGVRKARSRSRKGCSCKYTMIGRGDYLEALKTARNIRIFLSPTGEVLHLLFSITMGGKEFNDSTTASQEEALEAIEIFKKNNIPITYTEE